MAKNSNIGTLAFAIATAALGSVAFAAQTAPALMTMSASVGASCVLNTLTDVSFGTYVPGTEADATGTFALTCTSGAPVSVAISAGNGSGHSQGTDTRAMVSGPNFLSYDLFEDAGHTNAWPIGTGVNFTGTGIAVPISVYGRIRSNLTGIVNAAYTDTVNIVASF